MNEKREMSEHEEWEMTVEKVSRQFEFPKTPHIAAQIQQKLKPRRAYVLRPAVALLLLLLLAGLFAVPQIRAGVLEYIRLGAGNFLVVPSLTPYPTLTVPQLQTGLELSLEEAEAATDYEISLPSALSTPSTVYLQQAGLPMVVLVWYAPEAYESERLLLYIIDSSDAFFKFTPDEPEYTRVNGRSAVWFSTPHLMEYVEMSINPVSQPVEGNVLVWEANNMTYRLEGDLTLEEALRIAESMP